MMLIRTLQASALLLLAACSSNGNAVEPSRAQAPAYTLAPNTGLGAGQPATTCQNIQIRRKVVGVFCRSTSQPLLKELGVSVTPDAMRSTDAERSVAFATGMSEYPGTARQLHGHPGFTAEVDFDPGNQAVYRATATCLAAVSFGPAGVYRYAQLTLRDETSGKQILSTEAAMSIIDSLE